MFSSPIILVNKILCLGKTDDRTGVKNFFWDVVREKREKVHNKEKQ